MRNKYIQVIIFSVIFWFGLQPATDPDTGWHISTGKHIVETKRIPQVDPFSYSLPDHAYIAHSWLSDAISYVLVSQLGIISLSIIYALLTTTSLYFITKTSNNTSPSSTLYYLVPLIAFPAIEIIGQRPQAYSVLGMSILLYLITKRKGFSSIVWQIPLLFLLWTNLHGGVILGLGILVLWWMLTILRKSSQINARILTYVVLGSIAATLANPYTYKIFTFAWRMITNSVSFAYNTDWVPLFSPLLGIDSIPLRAIIIVCSFVAIIDNKNHKHLQTLSIIFSLLSIKSIRFLVPLLVVVSPLILQTLSRAFKSVSVHKFSQLFPY